VRFLNQGFTIQSCCKAGGGGEEPHFSNTASAEHPLPVIQPLADKTRCSSEDMLIASNGVTKRLRQPERLKADQFRLKVLSFLPVRLQPARGNAGFTLLELIIVLLLIGLITALVVVSLSSSLPSTKFRSEVRKLGSLLRYARNRAQFLNQEKEVILDLEKREAHYEGKTRVAFSEDTEIYAIDPVDGEIREGLYRLVFFPGGGSTGSVIVITRKGRKTEIQLDPLTGSVILQGGQEG